MNGSGKLDKTLLTGKLLDPLRHAYADFKDPTGVYYPDWKINIDTGYGSYSSWSASNQFEYYDYYRFYGGGPAEYCKHNGCSCDADNTFSCKDPEWTLLFSGAASCLEYYEVVDGAYEAGVRSANYVLKDLVNPGIEVDTVCDDMEDRRRKLGTRQLRKFRP